MSGSGCPAFPNQSISDAGIPCAEDVPDNLAFPTWQDSPQAGDVISVIL